MLLSDAHNDSDQCHIRPLIYSWGNWIQEKEMFFSGMDSELTKRKSKPYVSHFPA